MFVSKRRKDKVEPVYEKIMGELMNSYVGTDIMDQVLDPKDIEKTSLPLRYRLIVLGFLKKDSLEDVNDKLINNGCQPLYSRSSFEATLIYAFANQLSYVEWKRIASACEQARNRWKSEDFNDNKQAAYFQGKRITFGELERYVKDFSVQQEKELVTKQVTQVLDESIRSLGPDHTRFFQFYVGNLQEFSDVREKSRYYFCKYLYYNLVGKIERYREIVKDSVPNQEQLLSLLPIKAESTLRRRKTNPSELMGALRDCAISPAMIFEEFNYHFFEYVSLDWVELVLENISDVEEMEENQMKMVATYLKENVSKKAQERLGTLSDFEIVSQYWRKLQEDEKEHSSSRKGENAIRKYLRGDLDIDRTTLICFLLFWGSKEDNRNEISISEERINAILDECGFSMLRNKDSFDRFVIEYMTSSDPVSFLMEEMDRYINRGETFFIYEVYTHSSSNAGEIRKQMSF